ncbi:MAG: ABC-2 family transporter protein, partial [Acidobacteriota bacterium]
VEPALVDIGPDLVIDRLDRLDDFPKSLATPLLELLLSLPFVLVFSWLLKLPIQTDPGVLALFALSVAAGFTILFTIQFLIGSLTFWFERIFGFRDMVYSVFMLFSGQLIPIALLPGWAEGLSRVLPFESVYYVPATIYAARLPMSALLILHAQQLFWVGALVGLAMAVWGRGVSRYASQGG